MREKMRRWGVNSRDADKIIQALRKDKFIDDERFARAYSLDKLRYNHWGKYKIRFMLRSLHLPDEAIEYGLSEIDEEEYEKIKKQVIRTKSEEIANEDEYIKRTKIRRFLYSRGFSPAED